MDLLKYVSLSQVKMEHDQSEAETAVRVQRFVQPISLFLISCSCFALNYQDISSLGLTFVVGTNPISVQYLAFNLSNEGVFTHIEILIEINYM